MEGGNSQYTVTMTAGVAGSVHCIVILHG